MFPPRNCLFVGFLACVFCLNCRQSTAQSEAQDISTTEAESIRKEVIAAWSKRQEAVDSFSITYMTTVIKTPEGLKHLEKILARLEVGNANEQLPKDILGGQIYFLTHQITMKDHHLRTEYWKYASAEEQLNALPKLTPGDDSDDIFETNGEQATAVDPKSRVPGSEKTFRLLSLQDSKGYGLSSINREMLFQIVRGMLPEVQERFPLATAKFRLIPKNPKHAEHIVASHDNPASNHIHELTLDRSRGCLPVKYELLRRNGKASTIVNIDYPEDEMMPLFPSGWTTSWILPDGALKRVYIVSVSEVILNDKLSVTPETFEIPILEGTFVSDDRKSNRTKDRSRFSIMHDGMLRPIDVLKENYWETLERIKGMQ